MHRGPRLFIFGFACMGLAQAQADWRFAHPNADMRMTVNVQAVLKAPALTGMLRQKEQPAQVQLGLDLLSSVDRISISARQTGKDQDVLVLVTGSFDPSSIQALFPSSGASQVKQVGPHAILIGEGESFTQAVQRMAGLAPVGPSGELEQSDIWLAGSAALMSLQQVLPMAPPAFKAMRAFSFGLNLGDSPELNVVLNADGADGAAQMLSALRDILGPPGQALEGRQDGAKIRLHFLLPPEVMRAAQSQAASSSFAEQLQPLMGMLGLAGAAPANGGKIMIYGLDDGPREVKTK
jgi:hypothetical protein